MLSATAKPDLGDLSPAITLLNFLRADRTLGDTFKQMLRQQDKKSQTALHHSASNETVVVVFTNLYIESLGIEATREITQILNRSKENILIAKKNSKTVQFIWNFLNVLFEEPLALKKVLMTHYESGKNEETPFVNFEFFHDFFESNFKTDEKKMLLASNEIGKNLGRCTDEFIGSLIEALEDDKAVIKYFLSKKYLGESVFYHASLNVGREFVFQILEEKAKMYFENIDELDIYQPELVIDF